MLKKLAKIIMRILSNGIVRVIIASLLLMIVESLGVGFVTLIS